MKNLLTAFKGFLIALTLFLANPSETIGQISRPDTICIKEENFKFVLKEAEAAPLLRRIINNDKIIIHNLETAISIEKAKARKQKWIIGGSLGGGLLLTIIGLAVFK